MAVNGSAFGEIDRRRRRLSSARAPTRRLTTAGLAINCETPFEGYISSSETERYVSVSTSKPDP